MKNSIAYTVKFEQSLLILPADRFLDLLRTRILDNVESFNATRRKLDLNYLDARPDVGRRVLDAWRPQGRSPEARVNDYRYTEDTSVPNLFHFSHDNLSRNNSYRNYQFTIQNVQFSLIILKYILRLLNT